MILICNPEPQMDFAAPELIPIDKQLQIKTSKDSSTKTIEEGKDTAEQ